MCTHLHTHLHLHVSENALDTPNGGGIVSIELLLSRARLDKILMSEVIKKIKQKYDVLREIRRVLRKNGVLFAIERLPDKVDGLTKERAIAHREPTEKEEPTLRF